MIEFVERFQIYVINLNPNKTPALSFKFTLFLLTIRSSSAWPRHFSWSAVQRGPFFVSVI